MTSEVLAALIPNAGGGFNRINGQGFADGTGSIAHVPAGYFWFDQDENTFLWTNVSKLDLSNSGQVGRPDFGPLAQDSTLNFSITDLNAWQATDDLQWTVTNAGYVCRDVCFFPPTGATAYSHTWIHFGSAFDATKGDQQILSQLVTHSLNGWQFLTLDKSFGPAAISVPSGVIPPGVMVNASLSDLANQTVRANFSGAAFHALAPAMNPHPVSEGTLIELLVEPGKQPHAPTLLWGPRVAVFSDTSSADLSPLPVTSDLDLGDISYGNPYDSSWPTYLHYRHSVIVPYTPPGLPTGQLQANVEEFSTNLPTATAPMQPIVGPPMNPRINGVDFFQDQNGAGLTPTMQWDPPSVGSADEYQVAFCYFEGSPGGGVLFLGFSCVGSLFTAGTTVTVPPGLLQTGKYYFFTLTAIA